jgi:hypothetical protein
MSQEVPGSLTHPTYRATHNEVKVYCAMHKSLSLSPNTAIPRKGCLTLWKPRPLNLILPLFVFSTTVKKLFLYSGLAKRQPEGPLQRRRYRV